MTTTALEIRTNGKLSVKKKEELVILKRKMTSVLNKLGEIVQAEDDVFAELKKLRDKKKELTRKVDEEMKNKKLEMKRLKDEKLLALGARAARISDLKEIGASLMEKSDKPDAKSKKLEIEEAKVR